jgi:hypothetical protein
MPVSVKHHFLVVGFLLGIIIGLAVALLMLSLRVGPFRVATPPLVSPVQYVNDEEAVIIPPYDGHKEPTILPVAKVLFEYVEVTSGCGPHFEDECVNVRSGPGVEFPIVMRSRNGMVLKVGGKVERDGHTWYKVVFSEWVRYPERVTGDWYVNAEYVTALTDEGDRDLPQGGVGSSTKRIVVLRGAQKLYAYDGDKLFMAALVSTGVELTPTPRGTFTVYKKTPSRYMQGPIPLISDQYYDLPGVPWNLYFTAEGAVVHGAYWHDNFGKPSSHGCVNLPPDEAKKLYLWADVGTKVTVQD